MPELTLIYAIYGAIFGAVFPWFVVLVLSFLFALNAFKLMGYWELFRTSIVTAVIFSFLFSIYPS